MKKLKMLLLTCFMVMTNAAMAQDHLNLPYFTAGPIQYGMVSETALTYQGEATVQRCMEPGLKHVKIPYNVSRGLTNWTIEVIACGAFDGCSLESITLNDAIKFIESQAFTRCPLKTFTCPAKLRHIGMSAFQWCTELESIHTDNNLKGIGNACFWGCIKLKRFDCPKDMHTIGENAFRCCTSLEYVTLGDDMINIGEGAFSDTPNLKAIAITNRNPHDAPNAFCREVLQNTWLVVPDGCVGKYKAKKGWQDFVHVIERSKLK